MRWMVSGLSFHSRCFLSLARRSWRARFNSSHRLRILVSWLTWQNVQISSVQCYHASRQILKGWILIRLFKVKHLTRLVIRYWTCYEALECQQQLVLSNICNYIPRSIMIKLQDCLSVSCIRNLVRRKRLLQCRIIMTWISWFGLLIVLMYIHKRGRCNVGICLWRILWRTRMDNLSCKGSWRVTALMLISLFMLRGWMILRLRLLRSGRMRVKLWDRKRQQYKQRSNHYWSNTRQIMKVYIHMLRIYSNM